MWDSNSHAILLARGFKPPMTANSINPALCGADKENRTPNLCITSAMLCQIELCQQNGKGCKNRTCVCESQSLMPYHLANPLKYEKGKMEKPFLLSTKVQRHLQGLDISFCFLNTHIFYFGIVAMLVVFIA